MRLLLDTCVWSGALLPLRAAGHDVSWSGDWPADPGDEEILAVAHREKRILITLDKDFGELAVVRGVPHHGIVRLVGLSTAEIVQVIQAIVSQHGDDLLKGALVTANNKRVRVRPGP